MGSTLTLCWGSERSRKRGCVAGKGPVAAAAAGGTARTTAEGPGGKGASGRTGAGRTGTGAATAGAAARGPAVLGAAVLAWPVAAAGERSTAAAAGHGAEPAAAAAGGRPSAATPEASTVLSFSRCILVNLRTDFNVVF
jgi:hypothetical protein